MTRTIHFTKMHGAGNDYIYINTMKENVENPKAAAIQWSAPHTGIGSDGLVLIGHSPVPEADFSMRIFNADGSEAMMCGNASRCIGKYLYEKELTSATEIRLLTLSGVKVLRLHVGEGNRVDSVTVDMLEPALANEAQLAVVPDESHEIEIKVENATFRGTFVSMGNPHFVTFVDDVDNMDIAKWGVLMEHHPAFPERCNIEFAQLTCEGTIRTRVWERGSGITMACGTGACATAVAAAVTGRNGRQARIVMDGGTLEIVWNETDNHVYMSGPAAFAFEGEIALPEDEEQE